MESNNAKELYQGSSDSIAESDSLAETEDAVRAPFPQTQTIYLHEPRSDPQTLSSTTFVSCNTRQNACIPWETIAVLAYLTAKYLADRRAATARLAAQTQTESSDSCATQN